MSEITDYSYCPNCGAHVRLTGGTDEEPIYQCWGCDKYWVIYQFEIGDEDEPYSNKTTQIEVLKEDLADADRSRIALQNNCIDWENDNFKKIHKIKKLKVKLSTAIDLLVLAESVYEVLYQGRDPLYKAAFIGTKEFLDENGIDWR